MPSRGLTAVSTREARVRYTGAKKYGLAICAVCDVCVLCQCLVSFVAEAVFADMQYHSHGFAKRAARLLESFTTVRRLELAGMLLVVFDLLHCV